MTRSVFVLLYIFAASSLVSACSADKFSGAKNSKVSSAKLGDGDSEVVGDSSNSGEKGKSGKSSAAKTSEIAGSDDSVLVPKQVISQPDVNVPTAYITSQPNLQASPTPNATASAEPSPDPMQTRIPTSLRLGLACERKSTVFSSLLYNQTVSGSCSAGYVGMACAFNFIDTNTNAQGASLTYQTSLVAKWDSARQTCSQTILDGGASSGSLSLDCCKLVAEESDTASVPVEADIAKLSCVTESVWGPLKFGETASASCKAGYEAVRCQANYLDNNSVLYLGTQTATLDRSKKTCSLVSNDGGITEGGVSVDCCKVEHAAVTNPERTIVGKALSCKRSSSGWNRIANGSTLTAKCEKGYRGVSCFADYFDTNSSMYHGGQSGEWDSTQSSCSLRINDAGISEGQVTAECCLIAE